MSWPGSIFLHTTVWGAGSGSNAVFQTMVIPDYFGRAHQGSIRGMTTLIMIVVSSFGGPIGGYLLDAGMSYAVFWWAILAAVVQASVSFLFHKPPQPPRRTEMAALASGVAEPENDASRLILPAAPACSARAFQMSHPAQQRSGIPFGRSFEGVSCQGMTFDLTRKGRSAPVAPADPAEILRAITEGHREGTL